MLPRQMKSTVCLPDFIIFPFLFLFIQVLHVWEFIEFKEVITPFGRSGS